MITRRILQIYKLFIIEGEMRSPFCKARDLRGGTLFGGGGEAFTKSHRLKVAFDAQLEKKGSGEYLDIFRRIWYDIVCIAEKLFYFYIM